VFNPAGLMVDLWDEEVPAGAERQLKYYVINDLYQDWQGEVHMPIVQQGQSILLKSQSCKETALGREILTFNRKLPSEPGSCTIVAELTDAAGKVNRILRDFNASSGG